MNIHLLALGNQDLSDEQLRNYELSRKKKYSGLTFVIILPDYIYIPQNNNLSCCICFDYKNDDFVETKCCKQHYHKSCLDSWNIHKKNCPTCRDEFNIKFTSKKKRMSNFIIAPEGRFRFLHNISNVN